MTPDHRKVHFVDRGSWTRFPIEYEGHRLTWAEAANLFGVSLNTARDRANRGWPDELVFTPTHSLRHGPTCSACGRHGHRATSCAATGGRGLVKMAAKIGLSPSGLSRRLLLGKDPYAPIRARRKAVSHCSICGSVGHNARSCDQR